MEEKGIMEYQKSQLSFTDLREVVSLAEILYKSGYFSDIKSSSQAVVKILRGQELGIGPIQSLEQIYIIDGKTALSAGLIAARIKSSGKYDYRVVEHTKESCTIAFYEHGKEIGRASFTLEDAQEAGLTGKQNWKNYRENMLFWRALSKGARFYCPDVFGGPVYTREELEDGVDVESITIVEPEQNTNEYTNNLVANGSNESPNEHGQVDINRFLQSAEAPNRWTIFWSFDREYLHLGKEKIHTIARERYGIKDSLKELTKEQYVDFCRYLVDTYCQQKLL